MTNPEPDGWGFRGAAPKYDGRKGEPFYRWKLAYEEYILMQKGRGMLSTAEDQWAALPFAFVYSSPAYYEFNAKRADVLQDVSSSTPNHEHMIAQMWQWLNSHYGLPDAQELHDFLNMKRDMRLPAHQSVAGWGACVIGKFAPLKAQHLATRAQANQVFLEGLEEAVRTDLHPFLLENQVNQCPLESLVARAELVACGLAGLAALSGKSGRGGKQPVTEAVAQMSEPARRRLLRQLAAESGMTLSPLPAPAASASVQQRTGAARVYCSLHKSSTHSDADCRAQQSTAGSSRPQQNSAAAAQVPQRPQSSRCTHCGKPGHGEDQCWSKHPEQRPSWYQSQPQPQRAARAQPAAHATQGPVPAAQPHATAPAVHDALMAIQSQLQAIHVAQHTQQQQVPAPQPHTAPHVMWAMPGHAATVPAPQLTHVAAQPTATHPGVTNATGATQPQGPRVADPWAHDHSAHAADVRYSQRDALPMGFNVLPPSEREPRRTTTPTPMRARTASEQPAPAVSDASVARLVDAVQQLTQQVTLLLQHQAAPERTHEQETHEQAHTTDVQRAHAPAALPTDSAGSIEQQHLQVAEHNALERALWYLGPEQPASKGLRVLDASGNVLTTGNPMVDTGANCIIASAAWCDANGLRYVHAAQPLNGAMGAGSAAGVLLTPITLVLCAGTPHETRVTAGGKHGPQVLVSEGTGHVYDLLLGTAFLHRIGGAIDLFTRKLVYRPYLQSHHDGATKMSVPLRPYAVAGAGTAAKGTDDARHVATYTACCALDAPQCMMHASVTDTENSVERKHRAWRSRLRRALALGLLLSVSMLTAIPVAEHGDGNLHWHVNSSVALAAHNLPRPTFQVQTTTPAGLEAVIREDCYTVDEEHKHLLTLVHVHTVC